MIAFTIKLRFCAFRVCTYPSTHKTWHAERAFHYNMRLSNVRPDKAGQALDAEVEIRIIELKFRPSFPDFSTYGYHENAVFI